jgi:hypothetical protein
MSALFGGPPRTDSRIVSIGQLVLFSSESGDAWMPDPSEHLTVAWQAMDTLGRPHIDDTETTFTVAWTGQAGERRCNARRRQGGGRLHHFPVPTGRTPAPRR